MKESHHDLLGAASAGDDAAAKSPAGGDAAKSPAGGVAAKSPAGDEALLLLVRAYHDRVYRFGVRVCRDRYDADDAVQEAFVKLARRADVAKAPSALSWLMTVVRNACLRMLRPFQRERRVLGERVADLDETPSDQADPHETLERWELVRSVHAAIAALERPSREVLVLRELEGLTGEETCALLGLDPSAMKTRLHRARSQLRKELRKRLEEPRRTEVN